MASNNTLCDFKESKPKAKLRLCTKQSNLNKRPKHRSSSRIVGKNETEYKMQEILGSKIEENITDISNLKHNRNSQQEMPFETKDENIKSSNIECNDRNSNDLSLNLTNNKDIKDIVSVIKNDETNRCTPTDTENDTESKSFIIGNVNDSSSDVNYIQKITSANAVILADNSEEQIPKSSTVSTEDVESGSEHEKSKWWCLLCKQSLPWDTRDYHLSSCMQQFKHRVSEDDKHCVKERTTPTFLCEICEKDISHVNIQRRSEHINRCIDSQVTKSKPQEMADNPISQATNASTVITECPLCGKHFQSVEARIVHIKKCSRKHRIDPQNVIMALKLQEKHALERIALGLPPTRPLVSRNNDRLPRKRRIILSQPKNETESDVQMALAMSLSLKEEERRKQEEFGLIFESSSIIPSNNTGNNSTKMKLVLRSPTENDLPMEAKSKKKKMNQDKPVPALLLRTDEERTKIMLGKVSSLIAPVSPNKETEIPTLTSKSNDEINVNLGFNPSDTVADSVKTNVINKDCQLWALSSGTEDKYSYYIPELQTWISPSKTAAGSKLQSLSQIPGHRVTHSVIPDYSSNDFAQNKSSESSSSSEIQEAEEIPSTQEMINLMIKESSLPTCESTRKLSDSGFCIDVEDSNGSCLHEKSKIQRRKKFQSITECLHALVGNSWMSDVDIIVSHNKIIPAHQLLLKLRCPALSKELQISLKSKRQSLDWGHTSFEAAFEFLNFLYTDSCRWIEKKLKMQVLELAFRYGMAERFESEADKNSINRRMSLNSFYISSSDGKENTTYEHNVNLSMENSQFNSKKEGFKEEECSDSKEKKEELTSPCHSNDAIYETSHDQTFNADNYVANKCCEVKNNSETNRNILQNDLPLTGPEEFLKNDDKKLLSQENNIPIEILHAPLIISKNYVFHPLDKKVTDICNEVKFDNEIPKAVVIPNYEKNKCSQQKLLHRNSHSDSSNYTDDKSWNDLENSKTSGILKDIFHKTNSFDSFKHDVCNISISSDDQSILSQDLPTEKEQNFSNNAVSSNKECSWVTQESYRHKGRKFQYISVTGNKIITENAIDLDKEYQKHSRESSPELFICDEDERLTHNYDATKSSVENLCENISEVDRSPLVEQVLRNQNKYDLYNSKSSHFFNSDFKDSDLKTAPESEISPLTNAKTDLKSLKSPIIKKELQSHDMTQCAGFYVEDRNISKNSESLNVTVDEADNHLKSPVLQSTELQSYTNHLFSNKDINNLVSTPVSSKTSQFQYRGSKRKFSMFSESLSENDSCSPLSDSKKKSTIFKMRKVNSSLLETQFSSVINVKSSENLSANKNYQKCKISDTNLKQEHFIGEAQAVASVPNSSYVLVNSGQQNTERKINDINTSPLTISSEDELVECFDNKKTRELSDVWEGFDDEGFKEIHAFHNEDASYQFGKVQITPLKNIQNRPPTPHPRTVKKSPKIVILDTNDDIINSPKKLLDDLNKTTENQINVSDASYFARKKIELCGKTTDSTSPDIKQSYSLKNRIITSSHKKQGKKMSNIASQKISISDSPVTPAPDYQQMITPELKGELKKIGVRALPRKKAVAVLTYVYDQTHPWENDEIGTLEEANRSRSVYIGTTNASSLCAFPKKTLQTNLKMAIKVKKLVSKRKTKIGHEATSENSPKKNIDKYQEMIEDINQASQKIADSKLSSSQTSSQSSKSDTSDMPEESVLQLDNDSETEYIEKSDGKHQCTNKKLLDYIKGNHALYTKILKYEPINLLDFQKELKTVGIKIGISKVMDFLDEECVTFTIPKGEKYRRKQQARSKRFRSRVHGKLSKEKVQE